MPPRNRKPFGLAVHTTGSGIVERAVKRKVDVLWHCAEFYLDIYNDGPTYVAGWDGKIIQVVDEMTVAWHVGLTTQQRDLLESGKWREVVPAHDLWDREWRSDVVKNPLDICNKVSPNFAYIGIELPPLKDATSDGLYFTEEQHNAVANLATDIFARHAIVPTRRRICGHEDLNPLDRWDAHGGWDPGARRERPRFNWERVLGQLGL